MWNALYIAQKCYYFYTNVKIAVYFCDRFVYYAKTHLARVR